MTTNELVQEFVEFVKTSDSEDLERLSMWLDRLSAHYEGISFSYDDRDYPDCPDQDYQSLRNLVSTKFPSLGYYYVTTPVEPPGEAEVTIGDAIDDLADILRDLIDVQWYFEHTSVANALWHYEQNYKFHWSRHLRNLQSYLLHKAWGI